MKKILTIALMLAAVNTVSAQRYRGVNDDFPKFRIGVQGGWSYLIAKISSDVPADFHDYMKQLKSGYSIGADAVFYFKEHMGVGMRYSMFRTKNELNDIYSIDPVTKKVTTGKLKDDITIHYIGPSFNTRIISANQKFHFTTCISLGYLSYKNEATLIDDYQLKSSALASAIGFGFDYNIFGGLFAGADISGVLGTLDYYDVTDKNGSRREDLPDGKYESVSRIDLSAGVRWNF